MRVIELVRVVDAQRMMMVNVDGMRGARRCSQITGSSAIDPVAVGFVYSRARQMKMSRTLLIWKLSTGPRYISISRCTSFQPQSVGGVNCVCARRSRINFAVGLRSSGAQRGAYF
jgi:hypothetical protein